MTERARIEAALEERRRRGGFVDAGFQVQLRDAHAGGGLLASAVAFRLFLFLVPFVYVVFTVVGLAATTVNEDPAQLAKSMGITGVLASAVVNTENLSPLSQTLLLLAATVGLVLTARGLTKALFVSHWLVWGVPRVKPRGAAPALVIMAVALAATVAGVALNDLRGANGIVGAIASLLLTSLLWFAIWWWLSWRLPHAAVPVTALIPGAVLMAIGVDVLQLLTTYWIGYEVARKSNLYGTVGIALAVLLWVYVLGRFVVGSAGLNAALWQRHEERAGRPVDVDVPPARDDGTESEDLTGSP